MENEVATKKEIKSDQKLTDRQKAAIFLVSLSEEDAAKIFKHLNAVEVEKLSMEIADLKSVHSNTIKTVIQEFYRLLRAQDYVAKGGLDFAQTVMEKAFGMNEARILLDRIKTSARMRGFNSLKRADANQLVNFLIKEHPQTIALILSHLPPDQTADALSEFPEELGKDVAYRIATLGKISPNLLHEIEEAVDLLAETSFSEDMSKTGGAEAIAEILNKSKKNTERNILNFIEENDPDLALHIKGLMFVFEDIILIDDRGIQKILKQVDKKDLALALKATDENIKEKILKNMSERAAQLLREDLEFLGPVRLKEVEDAQRHIIEIVKQLEDEGEIFIAGRGKEDEIVM